MSTLTKDSLESAAVSKKMRGPPRLSWNNRLVGVALIVVLLVLWEVAAANAIFPPMSFPRISLILATWGRLIVSGELLKELLPSLWRMFAGYVIGVAVAGFARAPQIAPEWRLFIITGLMGGLSTFSTFSAEVVQRLQDGRLGWAAGEIVIHVAASLIMTILGIATVSLLSR